MTLGLGAALDKNEWTILDVPAYELEEYTLLDIMYEMWMSLWRP
jgi:hypothetical protein